MPHCFTVNVYIERIAVSTIMRDEGWFFDYNQHLCTRVVPELQIMGKKTVMIYKTIKKKLLRSNENRTELGFAWIGFELIKSLNFYRKNDLKFLRCRFCSLFLASFSICHRFAVVFHEWRHYLFFFHFISFHRQALIGRQPFFYLMNEKRHNYVE